MDICAYKANPYKSYFTKNSIRDIYEISKFAAFVEIRKWNNFLYFQWKTTKFDIWAYIANPYKSYFIKISIWEVFEISKCAAFVEIR